MLDAVLWVVTDPVRFAWFCWACGLLSGWMLGRSKSPSAQTKGPT